MELHISHNTTYRYDVAAHLVIQALRMWPLSGPGQRVHSWRVDADGARLEPTCKDGFGNTVATHTIDRSVQSVSLTVRGEVDTRNTDGVFGASTDTLPPMFYLLQTELTTGTEALLEFAHAHAGSGTLLDRLHRLSNAVRDRVDYLSEHSNAETTAAEAFEAGAGVCQDHAHVLITASRSLGWPARYVSGYLCPFGDSAAASHAWAEVYVDDLGWVGFDAANRQSPDERYVRVACGRDYRDAAPVRGIRMGGVAETLQVDVSIIEGSQSQSQSQSQPGNK